jgi:hypothetical protein
MSCAQRNNKVYIAPVRIIRGRLIFTALNNLVQLYIVKCRLVWTTLGNSAVAFKVMFYACGYISVLYFSCL